jgi:nucleoid DNA-binding protein
VRRKDVKLFGFGIFKVKHKKAWIRRNPYTGEMMEIVERNGVKFKLSEVLKTRSMGMRKLDYGGDPQLHLLLFYKPPVPG